MLIKRILFPVDFSDRCRGAAGFVEEFVGRFQAELAIVAVVEPYTYYDTMDKEAEIKKQLESFGPADFNFFRVNRVLLHGDPAGQIVDFSRSHPTDLIMMPTQGKGPYRRFLLGSVTAKVLHDADCPVWTGTHMEDAPPIEKISMRKILCAVDLDPVGVKALRWCAQLAEDFQAELSGIHVVPPGGDSEAAPIRRGRHAAKHRSARAHPRGAGRDRGNNQVRRRAPASGSAGDRAQCGVGYVWKIDGEFLRDYPAGALRRDQRLIL